MPIVVPNAARNNVDQVATMTASSRPRWSSICVDTSRTAMSVTAAIPANFVSGSSSKSLHVAAVMSTKLATATTVGEPAEGDVARSVGEREPGEGRAA